MKHAQRVGSLGEYGGERVQCIPLDHSHWSSRDHVQSLGERCLLLAMLRKAQGQEPATLIFGIGIQDMQIEPNASADPRDAQRTATDY